MRSVIPFYKLLFMNKPAFLYGGSLHNIFIDNDDVWDAIVMTFGNTDSRELRNDLFYITYDIDTDKYKLCYVDDDGIEKTLEIDDINDVEMFKLVSSKVEDGPYQPLS